MTRTLADLAVTRSIIATPLCRSVLQRWASCREGGLAPRRDRFGPDALAPEDALAVFCWQNNQPIISVWGQAAARCFPGMRAGGNFLGAFPSAARELRHAQLATIMSTPAIGHGFSIAHGTAGQLPIEELYLPLADEHGQAAYILAAFAAFDNERNMECLGDCVVFVDSISVACLDLSAMRYVPIGTFEVSAEGPVSSRDPMGMAGHLRPTTRRCNTGLASRARGNMVVPPVANSGGRASHVW